MLGKKEIKRRLDAFWQRTETRPTPLVSKLRSALTIQSSKDSLRIKINKIDMYIFEFWTIQLKILLVPGRCRVPIDYTFMPHDVENLLSI